MSTRVRTGTRALALVRWLSAGAVVLLLHSPVQVLAQETVAHYHTDAVGSVRMITDESGRVVARYDYLPFGEPWGSPPPVTNARQFAGKEKDSETGLDYFGARYYASGYGRFTTVDPVYSWQESLADPQRWNRYAYGLNNPLKNIDPDGTVPIPAIVAAAYAAYEVLSQAYDAYTLGTTFADPSATARAKAAAAGGFVLGAIAPGGGYGTAGAAAVTKADDIARALKRGRESEVRVLEALGEVKNTAKVRGCEGCSIPDYQNATTIGEIKDAKRVDNTKQIRIQREVATKSGRGHVVHTGTNTDVSRNVERGGTEWSGGTT